jgi:hypothetical protein
VCLIQQKKTVRWVDMDINKALEHLNRGGIEKGKQILEELRKENPKVKLKTPKTNLETQRGK